MTWCDNPGIVVYDAQPKLASTIESWVLGDYWKNVLLKKRSNWRNLCFLIESRNNKRGLLFHHVSNLANQWASTFVTPGLPRQQKNCEIALTCKLLDYWARDHDDALMEVLDILNNHFKSIHQSVVFQEHFGIFCEICGVADCISRKVY